MSTTIKLRRSSVPGNVPTTAQLDFGEVAINTADGKVFFKSGNTTFGEIQELSPHAQDILDLIKTVDGANTGLDADLLDGQEGTYYLDYNNFTNVPASVITLNLTGDITGSATSNAGIIDLVTELANTGVTPGTYGSSSAIPVITVDEDGRITAANTAAVGGVQDLIWTTANNTLILNTSDGTNYYAVINSFNDISANNITVAGLVDGRDIAADGLKLDGIEVNATADQTAAEILAALITVDGTGTNLDADLLDGQEGTYYLDYNNFTNVPASSLDLTLTGKVTGTAFTNTGVMSITTELANTGVTAGTYGSSSQVPVLVVDEDGRITSANTAAVAGVSGVTWATSNSTLSISTSDGSVYNTVIDTFDEITVNGNIIVSGLVDGRDVAADGSKLDGIEVGATADQTAADIRALGFFDITNDGTSSGLDADLLDGLHASDILAQAANTASAGVGNGLVTITANNGLLGTGQFNLNDTGPTTINLSHADTSSVANTSLSGGNVVTGITFDTYGHTLAVTSTDLDGRYYTETESDGLFVAQTIQVLSGAGLTGGGPLTANVTISHDDTSSQANVALGFTEFVDSIDVDDFGHITSVTKGVRNYLDLATADTRYVNATGDTMTGNLILSNSELELNQSRLHNSTYTSTTVFAQTIFDFAMADYGSAEIVITAKQGSDRHITKLLVVHDGSTAYGTEFASMATSNELATYDVTQASGDVRIQATPASSTSTTYYIVATLIDV
jgi:hypothetical protein